MSVDFFGNGDGMANNLGEPVNRRRFLRVAGGAGLAALVGGFALTQSAGAANFFKATSALNLRSKPRSTASIKLVIPANGVVVDLGVSSNGYRKVSYNGVRGYASESYLAPQNGGSGDPIDVIGSAITTTSVNLRYGDTGNSTILAVLPKGTKVQIGALVSNGYRQVLYNGTMGFIFDDYLAPDGAGNGATLFTTTSSVNLRQQPSTSAKVILVVPQGAVVKDYDLVVQNGFRGVEYKGKTGWVSTAYLD